MQEQRALGNILVRHGIVAEGALEPFYAQQREKPTPLFELLLTSKVATQSDLARALAAECRLPFLEFIDVASVPAEVTNKLPISYAKAHKLLVQGIYEDRVEIVCADPLDTDGIDDIRATFQKPVSISVAPGDTVIDAINQAYERQQTISELETNEVADEEE
ncbi:MAG TPA: type II secretion system protein GspE, partial [Polyangiaceae bacterium]|nr:type II secretion system protein GspE [Polyangiaceae bacterium]